MNALPVVCFPGASGHRSVYDALSPLLEAELGAENVRVEDYPGLGATPAQPDVDSHAALYRYLAASTWSVSARKNGDTAGLRGGPGHRAGSSTTAPTTARG